MPLKIRTGDQVLIKYENRIVEGECRLASANGRNLLLAFPEARPLCDYFGLLPVLEDRGALRDLIKRRPVEITRRDKR
jgi:hypothetical protein